MKKIQKAKFVKKNTSRPMLERKTCILTSSSNLIPQFWASNKTKFIKLSINLIPWSTPITY
jgi:hypothetical protein